MQPKDVLDDLHIEDLPMAVKNGSSHMVEALCAKFQVEQDPCVSQKSAVGYYPSFTSKVENVLKK